MERRTLLATVGSGVAAVAAGCLSSADPSDDSPGDSDTESDDDPSGTDDDPSGTSDEATKIGDGETERRAIGDGSLDGDGLRMPHAVALANRTDDDVEATFAIHRAGTVAFEERLELESDASIVASLTEIARYEVEATIHGIGAATTETLGLESFDCNGGQTTIALQPDGRLESRTVSTTMACLDVVTERVGTGKSFERTIGGEPSNDGDANGDDERHSLGLENPTEETWTVRAVLAESDGPLFDGVFTLEADTSVNLPIAEPGSYEFRTSVLETDATASESVGTDLFDCNASTTNATVDADGELAIRTISTMIACGVSEEADG